MTTTCENSVFGGLFRAWKRSRLGDILLGGRVVSMHTYDGGYFSSHSYCISLIHDSLPAIHFYTSKAQTEFRASELLSDFRCLLIGIHTTTIF